MKHLELTVHEVGVELARVQAEIRGLERRAATLRAFLAQARAIAGVGSNQGQAAAPTGAIWAAAQALLQRARKPLSLRNLAERLTQQGWVLKDGPEAVRLSIKHHPGLFRRVRPSVYTLRAQATRPPRRRGGQ